MAKYCTIIGVGGATGFAGAGLFILFLSGGVSDIKSYNLFLRRYAGIASLSLIDP